MTNLQESIDLYCSMLPNLHAESAMDIKRLYHIAYEAHKAPHEEVTLENLIDGLKNNHHFEASDEDIKIIAQEKLNKILIVKEILFNLNDVIK